MSRNILEKEYIKGIKVRNITFGTKNIIVKLPTGVFPVIGALNSIDSAWRTPNFNLIFGAEYLKNLDHTYYHNDYNKKYAIKQIQLVYKWMYLTVYTTFKVICIYSIYINLLQLMLQLLSLYAFLVLQ